MSFNSFDLLLTHLDSSFWFPSCCCAIYIANSRPAIGIRQRYLQRISSRRQWAVKEMPRDDVLNLERGRGCHTPTNEYVFVYDHPYDGWGGINGCILCAYFVLLNPPSRLLPPGHDLFCATSRHPLASIVFYRFAADRCNALITNALAPIALCFYHTMYLDVSLSLISYVCGVQWYRSR